MSRRVNYEAIVNTTINNWQILSYAGHVGNQHFYLCQCACGSSARRVQRTEMLKGLSKGCKECQYKRHSGDRAKVGPAFYIAYRNARARCTNRNHPDFKRYGARGIQFKFTRPMELWEEIGPRPSPLHTLDRIKNNRGYEPGNCRWSTRRQQSWNRRKMCTSRNTFKGVFRKVDRKTGRLKEWQAHITVHGRQIIERGFDNELDAAYAYDNLARQHFGEYAHLNFPHEAGYWSKRPPVSATSTQPAQDRPAV